MIVLYHISTDISSGFDDISVFFTDISANIMKLCYFLSLLFLNYVKRDSHSFPRIPFSLFIAPKYFGSGNEDFRTCIPLAVYCVKLVVRDRRVANKVNFVLDNLSNKSYNTTPAEEEKPLRWEFASLFSKAYDHMA